MRLMAVIVLILGFNAKSFSHECNYVFSQKVSEIDTVVVKPVEVIEEDSTKRNLVYFLVEDMPKFNYKGENEMQSFRNYLMDSIKHQDYTLSGDEKIYVSFIVEADGSTSFVKLARGSNTPLFEEVKRIILNSPKWTPGMQLGKPVRVTYTLPIATKR